MSAMIPILKGRDSTKVVDEIAQAIHDRPKDNLFKEINYVIEVFNHINQMILCFPKLFSAHHITNLRNYRTYIEELQSEITTFIDGVPVSAYPTRTPEVQGKLDKVTFILVQFIPHGWTPQQAQKRAAPVKITPEQLKVAASHLAEYREEMPTSIISKIACVQAQVLLLHMTSNAEKYAKEMHMLNMYYEIANEEKSKFDNDETSKGPSMACRLIISMAKEYHAKEVSVVDAGVNL